MSRLIAATLLFFGLPGLAAAAELRPLAGDPVLADGQSEVTVRIWCPSCQPEDRVRVRADGADIREAAVEAGGVVMVKLVAASVRTPSTLGIKVKVTGTQTRIDEEVRFPVVPGGRGTIGLSFSESETRAGGGPITVKLQPPLGPQDPAKARYAITASVGTIGSVTVTPDGTATASWTPPSALRASQLAVFAVVDEAAPFSRFGWGTLPIRASSSLTFQVDPDSQNTLIVGTERFGPVQASPAGTVAFEASLPPALGSGTLETVSRQGLQSSREVEIPLAKGALHMILPVPQGLPADPSAKVPVRVVRVGRDGQPVRDSPPSLSASRGTLGSVRESEQPGIYVAEWTAPGQTGTVEFTAVADGITNMSQANLVHALPRVEIAAEPEVLARTTRDLSLVLTARPPEGGVIQDPAPVVQVEGGKLLAKIRRQGGSWVAPLRVETRQPYVSVRALPRVPSTGAPAARLLAWAEAPPAPGQPVSVVVVAVDALGMPVPGLELTLAVPEGSGSLPPKIRTGNQGEALLSYKPGDDAEPAALSIQGGGFVTGVPVLPGGAVVEPGGDPITLGLVERWQEALPRRVLTRELPPPVVVTAPPEPAVSTAPEPPTSSETLVEAPAPEPTPVPPPARGSGWARLGVDLAGVALVYQSESGDDLVGPDELSYDSGNLLEGRFFEGFGIQIRALVFPGDGDFGLDAAASMLRLPADAGDADETFFEPVIRAGLRYRRELSGPLRWFVVGQFDRQPVFLFLYEDSDVEDRDLEPQTYNLMGGRLGAGLTIEGSRLLGEIEIGETFVPYPVNTRASLAGEYAFTERWAARLQLSADIRSMTFEVDGEEVVVKDQLQQVLLGVTARLP